MLSEQELLIGIRPIFPFTEAELDTWKVVYIFSSIYHSSSYPNVAVTSYTTKEIADNGYNGNVIYTSDNYDDACDYRSFIMDKLGDKIKG